MLIVLIPCQGKMRTPSSHLSWPVPLLSPQRTVLQDLHFNLHVQSQGSYELLVGKQLSLIQSVPLMFPIHLWLFKDIKWLEQTTRTAKFFFLTFPFLSSHFFSHFIWLHPPVTFGSIQCFPGHLCTLIWESEVGGGNNSTWKWAGDCLPPRVVMEGLSDRAPQAPPWWLISCGALELRSDTVAHQTPLSLTGTPLIARCFIIVPHSASVSGVLPSYFCVKEYVMRC